MSDIKPDTSLYTDLPNKLEAFAAALRFALPDVLEHRPMGGRSWSGANGSSRELCALLLKGDDFRIKPKPRELWVAYNRNGSIYKTSHDPLAQEPGATVVRFVEQPE